MWKKLRSDRDPRDTVFTELRREFGPHFGKAKTNLKSFANSYPRFLFWTMVINISLSAILSFTVFRPKDDPPKKPVKFTAPVSDGFDQIMQTSQAISEMLHLKNAIDSLSAKKTLTRADSATLEKALDRFQDLTKQINHK